MAEKRGWTMEEARALASRLERVERPADLDKRSLVQGALYPVIARKLRRGWTHEAVCEELARLGIEVAPSTLRSYLRKGKAARRSRQRDRVGRVSGPAAAGQAAPEAAETAAESAGDVGEEKVAEAAPEGTGPGDNAEEETPKSSGRTGPSLLRFGKG